MSSNRIIKKDGFVFKILEGVVYIFFVVIGLYLAFLIKFDMNPPLDNIQPYFDSMPYIIITATIIFYIYDIVTTLKKPLFENAITIAISLILIDIIIVAIVFFNRGFAFPRSIFISGFIIQFLLIFITKVTILRTLKLNRRVKDILIIAPQNEAEFIAEKILLDKCNLDSVKYICNELNGSIKKLIDDVDKIYIGGTLKSVDKLKIIKYCTERNKTVYLIPSFFEISLADFKIAQINDVPVLKIGDLGLTQEQIFIKRILDILISLIGLIILSPVILVISIIIKLYDGGPIFYNQERVTENNEIFKLHKFRTMVVDAEKYTGPVLTTEKDPRITPLGKFLRKSRLDELPQLFNVLKDDMSIVGPRPERPCFVRELNEEVDGFKYRVFVKAGITGLAQILGTYSTDPETKIKYDLLYIKNYSLLLDIKIMFNTIRTMFKKDSSKGIAKYKRLDEIFNELDLDVYEELGVTRIE